MSHRNSIPRKFGAIERDIFLQLSSGDLLIGMLLSGRSTKQMLATARIRAARRQAAQRAFKRLTSSGFVVLGSDNLVRLTPRGQDKLKTLIARMRVDARDVQKKWDEQWRLVAFDIPEQERVKRNSLRGILKRAGFILLQQSIWVHPHDCSDLQTLLDEDAMLKRCVVYARAVELSGEERLLKHFGLSRRAKPAI